MTAFNLIECFISVQRKPVLKLIRRTRIDRILDWPNGFWSTWTYLFKHTKCTPFVRPRGFGQSEIWSIRCLLIHSYATPISLWHQLLRINHNDMSQSWSNLLHVEADENVCSALRLERKLEKFCHWMIVFADRVEDAVAIESVGSLEDDFVVWKIYRSVANLINILRL